MISETAKQNQPIYDYTQAEADWSTHEDPIIPELIRTRAFQRLNHVRFLGGIDYVLVRAPNGNKGNIRYTRLQHSLGVAKLALLYSKERDMSFQDRRLALLAALLHDIGHAPFSHSLEPVFAEAFDLNHHRASEALITGSVEIGVEVAEILRQYHVDVDRLLAIISGKDSAYEAFFSGPINFDTVEGILRSQAYVKPNPNIPSPESVVLAAVWRRDESDRTLVDDFWSYKDQVYRHIINSTEGLLADFVCQLYLRTNFDKITAEDYFSTEPKLFRKLPGLRELLLSRSFKNEAAKLSSGPILHKVRRFYVVRGANFFGRDDENRYVQTKSNGTTWPKDSAVAYMNEIDQDLFDDEGDRAGKAVFNRQAFPYQE